MKEDARDKMRYRLYGLLDLQKETEDLGDTQWKAVLGRCRELHQRMGMEEQLDEDMTSTTQEIDTLSM